MPALTPARDLDVLDHISRDRGEGRYARSGWRVAIAYGGRTYEKTFADGSDPYRALADAVAWRDQTVNEINTSHARRRSALDESRPALGVRVTTSRSKGHEYPVVVATLPELGGHKRSRFVRSIDAHGLDDALRQACAWRHAGMRERYGDEYPFETADDLLAAVQDAEAERAEAA
jgi:hypothetical protein